MTAVEINHLLDAVIFNVAIGNVDSHAKNYSILLSPDGAKLAPLYDLMSGLAWTGITPNHTQAIGGQRRGTYVYGCHWKRMAKACGLAPAATVKRVQAITTKLLQLLPEARQSVADMPAGAMLDVFAATIERRITEVHQHSLMDGDDAVSGSVDDNAMPSRQTY